VLIVSVGNKIGMYLESPTCMYLSDSILSLAGALILLPSDSLNIPARPSALVNVKQALSYLFPKVAITDDVEREADATDTQPCLQMIRRTQLQIC
jgi:hypothetical protein